MHSQLGLSHFWEQGDGVSHAVAVILLLLSVASWCIIIGKALSHWRASRTHSRALAAFWNADSLPQALEAIRIEDASGILAGLALSGAHAAQAHEQHAARGIGAGVHASEFVTRCLRQSIVSSQARIEQGLTFLASVGSTAPFIGLFGTVWGIYHALAMIGATGQASLDKVAGPVGEALIMTAAGLFVAIPAVLAYNTLTRAVRVIEADLDAFAHDLHAFFTTGQPLSNGAVNAPGRSLAEAA